VRALSVGARSPIQTVPRCLLCDARALSASLDQDSYDLVITSPPYPNRVSYIRELRPYMYWLGYLKDGRQAGELDWLAIGGTWGCATSNLNRWEHPSSRNLPFEGFRAILTSIAEKSEILSRYLHKYFYDMYLHFQELFKILAGSGKIYYIIGNTKFYDVVVSVEAIFAALLDASGFRSIEIRPLRKRSSKKELVEYIISARKP
jgi:DNA modification methylase